MAMPWVEQRRHKQRWVSPYKGWGAFHCAHGNAGDASDTFCYRVKVSKGRNLKSSY